MGPTETRRQRLRSLIEEHSATKLAQMLGYKQPTFLSQMAGPNPTRVITEKTARKFEGMLKLPEGYLDTPENTRGRQALPDNSNASTVAEVVRLVCDICEIEGVNLTADKLASVTALVYDDAVAHGGQPRAEYVVPIVRLLK